jgi:Zn-dependent protease with chaperone function/ribosomal protein L29
MLGYATLMTALGWSLLNSIWQMAALWILFYFLTAQNDRMSAAGKHNLALVFVVIGSGWMVVSFFRFPETPLHPGLSALNPLSETMSRWIPFLSDVYLFILVVRIIKYGFRYADRTRDIYGMAISPELQSTVDRFRRLLSITKIVRIHFSEKAETAETSGFLKPLILLPATLITRLTPDQLEAILIHELFHIRRNDYLINIFISGFHSLLFFNPFARLFCREISRERENACDDEVMERGYAPELYAKALFSLEKYRNVKSGFSLAADGHEPWLLMERIKRLLGKPSHTDKRLSPVLICALVLSVGLFGLQQKSGLKKSVLQTPILHALLLLPSSQDLAGPKLKPLPVAIAKLLTHKPVQATLAALADTSPEPEVMPDVIQADNEDSAEKIVFADNVPVRNFSNEQDAGPSAEDIHEVLGTPYVPSASLSYDAQADLTHSDSIMEIAMQNRISDLIRESHLSAKVSLDRLKVELAKNRTQLKKLELKNHHLILQHRRDIKPLLENIEQQLHQKEQKIDLLKLQLQSSDEDIIHI